MTRIVGWVVLCAALSLSSTALARNVRLPARARVGVVNHGPGAVSLHSGGDSKSSTDETATRFLLITPEAGWTPGTWPFPAQRTPTAVWYASDPTGSGGISFSASETGSTETAVSPVCTGAACWPARRFDGANDLYTATSINTAEIGTGDATICMFGRAGSSAVTQDRFFGTEAATPSSGYSCAWLTGGDVNCTVYRGGSSVTAIKTAVLHAGAWGGFCLAVDNDGGARIYNLGTAGSLTSNIPGSGAIANDVPLQIGNGGETDRRLNGDIAGIWFIPFLLTSAQSTTILRRVVGSVPRVGNEFSISHTYPEATFGVSGKATVFGYYFPPFFPSGLSFWDSTANKWTNFCDASSWTDVGTPSVSTDVDSGPFSEYYAAAEGDRITDDDGGTLEGKRSATAGTLTGTYTASCFLRSDSVASYTLSVSYAGGGGGGGSCTGTDLTTTWARKSCTPSDISGTPTAIYGNVLVGDGVGVTGSILVSGCQIVRATRGLLNVCPAGSTAVTCAGGVDGSSTSGANFPTSNGRVLATVTPGASWAGSQIETIANVYHGGNGGWSVAVDAGRLRFQEKYSGSGDTGTFTYSAVLTWNVGTQYTVSVRWRPDGTVQMWRDGVSVASSSGNQIANGMNSNMEIGMYSTGNYLNGTLGSLSIGSP